MKTWLQAVLLATALAAIALPALWRPEIATALAEDQENVTCNGFYCGGSFWESLAGEILIAGLGTAAVLLAVVTWRHWRRPEA